MPPIQIKLDDKQLQLTVNGVKQLGKAAIKAVLDEIGAMAIDILGKSVEILKKNGSVATSKLANSGRVKKIKNGWTVGYIASYAWVVEYGRRANSKRPPLYDILQWVHKKRLAYYQEETKTGKNKGKMRGVKGAGYWKAAMFIAILIANSIGKKGIKPKPFLTPSFNEIMKGFNNRVINAINKALK